MNNCKTQIKKLDITIRPVKNMEGDFIAYYKSDMFKATYSVYFKDTIMGALALNAFYDMLKQKYKQDIEFSFLDQELKFKNQALLDVMSDNK